MDEKDEGSFVDHLRKLIDGANVVKYNCFDGKPKKASLFLGVTKVESTAPIFQFEQSEGVTGDDMYGKKATPKTISVCWSKSLSSRSKTSKRTIPLNTVLEVVEGKRSLAFQKAGAIKSVETRCFTLLTTLRTLDIEMETEQDMRMWVKTLRHVIVLARKDSDAIVGLFPNS